MVGEENNSNISPGMQEESAAASSAMVVTGMEKELKSSKVKLDLKDQEVDLKQANEFVQRLKDSHLIEKVKKFDQKEKKKKDEENEEEKKRPLKQFPIAAARPFEWLKGSKGNSLFELFLQIEGQILRELL